MAKKTTRRKASKPTESPAVELPARCPRQNCRSTSRTKKEGVRTKQILGRTADGESFNEVRYCYVTCADCGHRYQIRSFHLVARMANT